MADEVTITSSLRAVKDSNSVRVIDYQSGPTQFQGDLTGSFGPAPGVLNVSSSGTGTSPDLSEITNPGYVRFMNLDDTNFVELGLLISAAFQQLFEILPGETYVMRFSRNITAAEVRLLADTADCKVLVECFEK